MFTLKKFSKRENGEAADLTDRWFVVQKDADKDPKVRVYHAAAAEHKDLIDS